MQLFSKLHVVIHRLFSRRLALVVGCVGGRPTTLAGGTLLVSTVCGELANMDSPVSEEDGE